MPKAHAASHDRGEGVSTSLLMSWALASVPIRSGPNPESIGGPGFSPFDIRLGRIVSPHLLPSQQFQALFDSLFKVLFIFPSQYMFAIAPHGATWSEHDGALTLSGAPFQGTWARSVTEDVSPDYNSNNEIARFSSWAIPGSLAVTRGIPPDLGSQLKYLPQLVVLKGR
ncbi:hypothetical protein RHMOL_Rhmol11G0032800 [Rhododendron molle]|uniref:Uncharacterized protein n=1 Tax=Rhododendron molle TaxID=49168 RepID=A0ACC0LNF1_RHOML|nr:hypothetical protein RHMOL_Rhmol11G0032800 [Rhododendron molle]